MTEAETSFLFFLAKNEPVTDYLSETRDNPDHSYHHIPEDSQVVANGMKFGIDVAGRHVYRVGRGRNEMFYAWDQTMMLEEIKKRLIAGENLVDALLKNGIDESDLTEDLADFLEDVVHDVFDMESNNRKIHEIEGWSWTDESRIGVSESFSSVLMRLLSSKA